MYLLVSLDIMFVSMIVSMWMLVSVAMIVAA